MGKLDFPLGSAHSEPRCGPGLGHWHLTREKGATLEASSLCFSTLPEGWRIIHDHTSVVPGS